MENLVDKIRDKIKAYLKQRDYEKWCKKDEWMGLIPGDVVGYKGQEYIYMGINKDGGPGMPMMAEPIFWYADPKKEGILYLRPVSRDFPKNVFGENNEPILAGGIESISRMDFSGDCRLVAEETTPINSPSGYIGFLNTDGRDMKKLKHISPQEWNQMIEETRAELSGGAPQ